ncbi:MAG: YbaK/EbsC family protein [Knoellia sp.]
MTEPMPETGGARRAREALQASGIEHRILVSTERASSLAEAAQQRGIEPRDIVKSLVVRRGSGNYVFVLVPGDREISWPKLRTHLGVNRLSMPPADKAQEATGYERGTITPFGSTTVWPVIADATCVGRMISMGAGAHGTSVTLAADDLVRVLDADVADVTDPF